MNSKYIKEAKIKEGQGDLKGAIKLYKKSLEENPGNYSLQIEIGNLLATIGDYEEAAGFFRRANRFYPNNKNIINALGFCLCSIGNTYQLNRKYELSEIVKGDSIFCATGITTGDVLSGIQIQENEFLSETFVTHKSSQFKEIIKRSSSIKE